jgi:hypothetical protein
LYWNTTGSNNTALGSSALQYNTTASNNTAVGYQAGYSTTTGVENTFIGKGAGYANTTGSYSVHVGAGAGTSCTSGQNTLVGYSAGGSLTSGNYNTIVGPSTPTSAAGYALTTGSKNTIIGGYNGNQYGVDIRTSSNNIVLSDGDGVPSVFYTTAKGMQVGQTSTLTSIGDYAPGFRGFSNLLTNLSTSYVSFQTFAGNGCEVHIGIQTIEAHQGTLVIYGGRESGISHRWTAVAGGNVNSLTETSEGVFTFTIGGSATVYTIDMGTSAPNPRIKADATKTGTTYVSTWAINFNLAG